MPFRPYTKLVVFGCLLVTATVCAFNLIVDPYAVFEIVRRDGFNDVKPFAGERGRTVKLYQVERVRPAGLVVGNSRPEMGLDPDHACWPEQARPVYNGALPGLSVYGQVRFAQHAMAASRVAVIVQGVDFIDFLSVEANSADSAQWPPTGAGAGSFRVDPDGRPRDSFTWTRVKDTVAATLSLSALGHGLATLLDQDDAAPTLTTSGFKPGERLYEPIVRAEGTAVLFAQKNREIARRFGRPGLRLYAGDSRWSPEFEAVRQLIRRARPAETVLFINPYHAEYLVAIELAGLWPQFEDWKRRLAELADAEDVALWDFSAFDAYATEATADLPARGESLQWFWEPAHYRRELGDIILANIWARDCPVDTAAPSYGVRLDGTDTSALLAAGRANRDAWMASNPTVVDRLRDMHLDSGQALAAGLRGKAKRY